MTGITLPAALAEWVHGWNAFDVGLAVFLALYALAGIRRGFVSGVIGFVGIVLTVLIAFRTYPAAATWLSDRLPVPGALANVADFFAVLIVAQLLFGIVTRIVWAALRPARRILRPLAIFDHALGALPGLAQGVAIAALVLALLRVLAAASPAGQALQHSMLAPVVTGAAAAVAPQLQPQVEQVIGNTPLVPTRLIEPDDTVRIIPRQDF